MANNIRTEIVTVNTSKYTGYTRVYKRNGQEFPALVDLLGKIVTTANGTTAVVAQKRNGIVLYANGNAIPCAYGRRLTAYKVTKKGTLGLKNPEFDIVTVTNADGDLFWQRVDVKKEKPLTITQGELKNLIRSLYGKEVKITEGKRGHRNRKLEELTALLEEKPEAKETINIEVNPDPAQAKFEIA